MKLINKLKDLFHPHEFEPIEYGLANGGVYRRITFRCKKCGKEIDRLY